MSPPVQSGPPSHNHPPSGSATPSRTYSVQGINLKAIPFGESDRLITCLTPERGLLRAIAPGARKQTSRLAGRSSIFVVNQLMLARGKTLDRIIQAETQYSFPGLANELGKLTAAQYLAEIVLYQDLGEQPQADLYYLLLEHLERIEAVGQRHLDSSHLDPSHLNQSDQNHDEKIQTEKEQILARLSQAVFHLLSLSGLAPQSHQCSLSRVPIEPRLSDPRWAIGFSAKAGGLIQVDRTEGNLRGPRLNALEAAIFQRLAESDLPDIGAILETGALASAIAPPTASQENPPELHYRSPWFAIEHALRQYVQYHFDRTIRSASLIDSYFSSPLPTP